MEARRNCCLVILAMIEKIPLDREEFVKDLKWNFDDASYKAPEQNIQWVRTQQTLIKHLPDPKEEWEFEMISIFTNKTIEKVKSDFGAKE